MGDAPSPPRPNLGRGLLALCRAFQSTGNFPELTANGKGVFRLVLTPLEAVDADAFAARVVALADDGDHAGGAFLTAIASGMSEGAPTSEALASFVADVDAALPLPVDDFEGAVRVAFGTLLHKLRALPFLPSSQNGTTPPSKDSEP